jgi:hypothetical protein
MSDQTVPGGFKGEGAGGLRQRWERVYERGSGGVKGGSGLL